jgi:hypothetical protein
MNTLAKLIASIAALIASLAVGALELFEAHRCESLALIHLCAFKHAMLRGRRSKTSLLSREQQR